MKKKVNGVPSPTVAPAPTLSEVVCLKCLYHVNVDAPGSCDAVLSDDGENLVRCRRCAGAKKSCVPVDQTPSIRASVADNDRYRLLPEWFMK